MGSNYNLALYYPEIVNDDYVKQNVISSSNNLGTTSGRGSSTRIFSNCIETPSETYEQCLNLFLAAPPPGSLPVDNLLFDTSFKGTEYIADGKTSIGPNNIPLEYKNVIAAAAARWQSLLTLTPDYVNYVRNYDTRYRNWNGINFSSITVFKSSSAYASCSPVNFIPENTTIFTSVRLTIYSENFDKYPAKQLDILTHEFGHGLGFSNKVISKVNGTGNELLPKILENRFQDLVFGNPNVLENNPWPGSVSAYNSYDGYKAPQPPKTGMPENNTYLPIQKGEAHWYPFTLKGISNPSTLPPTLTTNFMYRGFYNEIMISGIDENSPNLVISGVTLNYLLKLYSIIGGKTIKNYKATGKTEVKNSILSETLVPPPLQEPGYDIIAFNIDESKSFNMENTDTAKNFINFCPTCENTCNHFEYIPEKQVSSFIPQKKVISMYNFIQNK